MPRIFSCTTPFQTDKGVRDVLGSDELFDCKPAINRAFHFAKDKSTGMNCIKIGLPGKLILSKRKGLREVLFP